MSIRRITQIGDDNMFSGIHIPKFFGGRRKRITQLLKEGEELSSKELEREEVIASFFKYFSEFIQESKEKEIQKELENQLGEKEREEVLVPYFGRLLDILTKIRSVLNYLEESNIKILENVDELNKLVEEHNKSRWRLIPRDEKNSF
jgi:hypothetical protein